jgi:VanZ family protein
MQLIHRHDDRLRPWFFAGWCLIWLAVILAIVDPSPRPLHLVSDKVVHFASFFAISLASVTFCRTVRQLCFATAFCAVAAIALESTHYVLPQRSFELADMAANLSGMAAGALLVLVVLRTLLRRWTPEAVR